MDGIPLNLEQRLRLVEDREEIKELKAKYCWYATRGEWSGVADLFVEDSIFDARAPGSAPVHWEGRAEILRNFLEINPKVMPLILNEIIEITGEEAVSTCTMLSPIGLNPSSRGFTGQYRDLLR